MARQQDYQFTRREIARHVCKDCRRNVIKLGDYCMISSEIWEEQFKLGWDDNLCIMCIEERLGRTLTPEDLCWGFTPAVAGYPKSELLLSRVHPPRNKSKARR